MENFDSNNMQEEISGGLVWGKGWGLLNLNGAKGKNQLFDAQNALSTVAQFRGIWN